MGDAHCFWHLSMPKDSPGFSLYWQINKHKQKIPSDTQILFCWTTRVTLFSWSMLPTKWISKVSGASAVDFHNHDFLKRLVVENPLFERFCVDLPVSGTATEKKSSKNDSPLVKKEVVRLQKILRVSSSNHTACIPSKTKTISERVVSIPV